MFFLFKCGKENVATPTVHTHHVLLHQILRILVEINAEGFYDGLSASIDIILKNDNILNIVNLLT